MISVLDYTRKLLYEHDCVVLPDLGGFLAYFSHAFYSEQNALYHAPQKRVAFNEALKLDDGLLTHYMTINEQITREEAQTRVRQFVEEIKNTIKEKGNYTLDGIGILDTNDEGKLQFEPTVDTNFYAEGFGLKSVSLAPAASIDVSGKSNEDWTSDDRPAEELELEIPRRRRTRIVMYIGGVLLIGTVLFASITQLPSESLKSSLNPFELITTVKGWLATDKKTNTVKKEEVVATENVVAPKEEVASEVVAQEEPAVVIKKEEEPVAATKETAKVEEKQVAPARNQETVVTPAPSSDVNGEFLVIAGGFSKIENARNLTAKLQSHGYSDATILNPEPNDGKLIIVSAIACESSVKAKSQVAQISRLAGAKAYVIHK